MSTSAIQAVEETTRVFDHHLGAFAKGLDELMKDYDESSVIVTPDRSFRGAGEIRGFFKAFLDGAKPEFWDAFKVTSKSTEGEIGYLVWDAKPFVPMATNTLFVRDGKNCRPDVYRVRCLTQPSLGGSALQLLTLSGDRSAGEALIPFGGRQNGQTQR